MVRYELLSHIDPGVDYTLESVLRRLPDEHQRAVYGGLSPTEFADQLFGSNDFGRLPVGHLLDHRVHMPLDLARKALDDKDLLTEILRRMLHSVRHPQATKLIAPGLRLDIRRDSEFLCDAAVRGREPIEWCLRGYHGSVADYLVHRSDADVESVRQALALMMVYYGALDVQLIAARQRAVGEYRFTTSDAPGSDRSAAMLGDVRAMFAALKIAGKGVAADQPSRGRKPALFHAVRQSAEHALTASLQADPGRTEETILAELRETVAVLCKWGIDAEADMDRTYETARSDPARKSDAVRIGTDWAGESGGRQLAFASMRLHAFSQTLAGRLNSLTSGDRSIDWVRTRLPAASSMAVRKLLLVQRSIIWQEPGMWAAFNDRGGENDLVGLIAQLEEAHGGRVLGQDLIESVKTACAGPSAGWLKRAVVVDGVPLADSQRWDILPDYRVSMFVPGLDRETHDRGDGKMGYVVKAHQPSPRYRAPRASHRPC